MLLKHPLSGGLAREGMESLLVALEDCCRAICAFETAAFEAGLCAFAVESAASLRAKSDDDYCTLVIALHAALLTSYYRGILAVKGYGLRVKKLLGRADFEGVVRSMPTSAQDAHRVAWEARHQSSALKSKALIIGVGVRLSARSELVYSSRVDLSGAAVSAAAVRTAADWWCLELQLRREALLVDLGSCVDMRKALLRLPASLIIPAAKASGGPGRAAASAALLADGARSAVLADVDGF